MKYYEICMGDGDQRFCHPRIDPKSPWKRERLTSNRFKEIHELPIPMIVDNKYPPFDYLLGGQIVSKKAFELIKSLNKNIIGFETQMFYKDEKIWDVFYTIIVPKYKIFNWDKSDYETSTNSLGEMFLLDINKLVLDTKKLRNIREDNIFTMEEEPVGIYCTEKAKQAIEASDLIGFGFKEIPVE